MKFKNRVMVDLAYSDVDAKEYEIIKNEFIETSRWSTHHHLIFKVVATGKFYSSYYSKGATENQCEDAYEYDGEEIECCEVEPKEVKVIQYVAVQVKETDEDIVDVEDSL